jgi:hypothetical protein
MISRYEPLEGSWGAGGITGLMGLKPTRKGIRIGERGHNHAGILACIQMENLIDSAREPMIQRG